MTDFVMQATGKDRKTADYLRSKYWADHGTTLAGLMKEHQVDPLPHVSFLVHLYSTSYMEGDPHTPRFMGYLSLFTFFMLILVSSQNYLQLFIG